VWVQQLGPRGADQVVVLVPGTLGGDRHAILPLGYLPVDSSLVGTVHSHPGPYAIPSDADKQLFRHFGHTHVIIAEPYNERTWIAYDHDAREIELEVVE
ncbi:MAG TPA: Mov34/MPN/PAD-1 family protein, partial [Candidatus Thermoplasmatota archaeon]|nr:Mov34/MPN/PAD-1 family protein [Candidatus Thermoplasmatota archaeon]